MKIMDPAKMNAVEIKAAKGKDGKWRGYLYAPIEGTVEDMGILEGDHDSFGEFDSFEALLIDIVTSIRPPL